MIGSSPPRVDALTKATGKAVYVDDLRLSGLVHMRPVLARVPSARVRAVCVERARGLPGVRAVITGADVPGANEIGCVQPGQPLLATEVVRYVGDVLALVVADTAAEARAAAAAVEVELEPLPGVFDVGAALAPGAPRLHPDGNVCCTYHVHKGDAEAALAGAAVTVERTFRTHHQEHAYLETLGAVAEPLPDGGMSIYGSLQCPHYVQKGVAGVLGLPYSAVRVVQLTTGGGFGGKEDVPTEICAMAAVGARLTGRPVKLVLDRDEDILRSSKRHPTVVRYRLGADRDGRLVAAVVDITADCGAYATLSPIVLWRSTVHGTGPYVIPAVKVECTGVYTNHPPAGAFRGFGAPQVALAHEGIIDDLARTLGLDPLELRLRNALHVGAELPTGAILEESAPLRETLAGARARCRWDEKRPLPPAAGPRRRGIGVACIHYGVSLGAKGWVLDASGALVQVHGDGSVSVSIGGAEIGQGAKTTMALIAAEALGCPLESVRVLDSDTALVADSGPTVASRTTIMSGNAVIDACRKITAVLAPVAADLRAQGKEPTLVALAKAAYLRNLKLAASGWYVAPPSTFDAETGLGSAYFVYAFATHIAEVEVDTRTGEVTLLRMTAAHDIGRAINRNGVEGQVEGAVLQGLGYARFEDFRLDAGRVLTSSLTTYLVPTAADAAPVDLVLIEEPWAKGPFGAKGIGEPALIPAAAAIANAVDHALGRTVGEIPLTPEVVWRALRDRATT
ncbi:MAG TPA: xanthine dehydrogenase family protein molybdopterin-binding subunit [Polyangia bacterium]